MKSPFKFLDAYTLKDKEVFFGREEEVANLYQMVNKNRLILVYGQSGTGKTSLVQCGLAGEFDVAQALHDRYAQVFDDLFIDTNPIPVKAAMAMMGMIEEIYRLPMCSTTDENKAVLRKTLENAGVL